MIVTCVNESRIPPHVLTGKQGELRRHVLFATISQSDPSQLLRMPKKSSSATPASRRPAVKPPVLMERTQPVIERLSAALGEPVFTYWNSTKGAICQNDVAGLYALMRSIGKVDRISLFIKSDGGSGQAPLRMVNLLRQI